MYSTAFVKMFLPGWLLEHFEVAKFEDSDNQIDIYLDEHKEVPDFLREHKVISHGFTQAACIQDFPVRGKAVFLHLRRRKWLDTSDGSIHSNTFDLTHKGTQLTKELVAFSSDGKKLMIHFSRLLSSLFFNFGAKVYRGKSRAGVEKQSDQRPKQNHNS